MTHVCARGHVAKPNDKGRCPRCGHHMIPITTLVARRRQQS